VRLKAITQGSVIHGIRSKKYNDCSCSGIVVSARCDLANSKIQTVYLVSALKVEQWIIEVGVFEAMEDLIRQRRGTLAKWAQQHGYDMGSLEEFSIGDIERNINIVCEHNKERTELLSKWKEFFALKQLGHSKSPLDIDSHRDAILKFAKQKVKDICKSAYGHYCFIPASTIQRDSQEGDGFIVDLQDILALPIELIRKIQEDDCDGMILANDERILLDGYLYLPHDYDFATVIGTLPSPWVEWLLQCFSNSFVRIGVDRTPEHALCGYIDTKFGRRDSDADD